MAIAEHVREQLGDGGPARSSRGRRGPELRMPNIGEALPRPYAAAELIARDPDYGRVVCFCERVTRGEMRDALRVARAAGRPRRPAPPHARPHGSLPGLLLRRASWPPLLEGSGAR